VAASAGAVRGGPAEAEDKDDGAEHRTEQREGQRWVALPGDGDDSARGGLARVTALGVEALVAQNEKPNQSRSELCGMQGEKSSALVQFF
jgi:hypothetical protein